MDISNCRNIGIMGGSFDPIHIGHLAMAQEACEYFGLDKILFIPTGKSPHKDRKMTSPEKRLEWVKTAVKDNPLFEYSDYESRKKTPSYTLETIEYLKNNYPEVKFYYILGEDSLLEIETWYRYEELLSKCVFLAARRSPSWEDALNKKIQELISRGFDVREIPFRFLEISSTEIRGKFKAGQNPRYYLLQNIYKDILEEKIYNEE